MGPNHNVMGEHTYYVGKLRLQVSMQLKGNVQLTRLSSPSSAALTTSSAAAAAVSNACNRIAGYYASPESIDMCVLAVGAFCGYQPHSMHVCSE